MIRGFICVTTRSFTPGPQYASPMPYSPESVSILTRFQSQVPRTIMHFTSVILIFLRCCAASCSNAAGSEAAPQAAVFRKERRFILEFPLGRILLWDEGDCYVGSALNLPR